MKLYLLKYSLFPILNNVGVLSAVSSLNLTVEQCTSVITLTWTPPFTLDITQVEPDISGYCVDIINSTSSLVLFSQCGINVTVFSHYKPPENAVFVVTPVNIVGNGTQQNISYSSMRFTLANT
jgi:hypothetical protein